MIILLIILVVMPVYGVSEQAIINSVTAFYPKIIAARERVRQAEGQYLADQGAFDAALTGSSLAYENGVYDGLRYTEVGIKKPLPIANASLFGGYSKSSDNPYPEPLDNDSNNTLDGGRVKLGASVSLLRGFLINPDTAALTISERGIDIANAQLELTEFMVITAARKAYYNYTAARQLYAISQEILALRQARLDQVQAQVLGGEKPELDLIDAQQALLKSESDLILAQQSVQERALALSLYYRDESGNRVVLAPETAIASSQIVVPARDQMATRLAQLKESRSDIRALDFEIEQTEAKLALYKNQVLPDVTLKVSASKDFGQDSKTPSDGRLKREERFNADLAVSIPLQTNKQAGFIATARAKIAELEQKKRLIQDSLDIDTTAVYTQITSLYTVYENLKQDVAFSKQLLAAESVRFRNGDSDSIRMNIREQALYESTAKLADAVNKIRKAIAEYDLILMSIRRERPSE